MIRECVRSLKPGQAVNFSRHLVEEKFKPRGQNLLQALALASGGNRPEPVQTSMDVFKEFLAKHGCELWHENLLDSKITVKRKTKICPTCGGRGIVQMFHTSGMGISSDPGVSTVEIETENCQKCDGNGAVGADPDYDYRSGDYDASDGWIREKYGDREKSRSA